MVRVLTSGVLAGTDDPAPGSVVRRLRDGGHEVIVVGAGVSADQLAATAVQEDVVAIALVAGGEDPVAGDLPAALAAYDARDIVVFATE